MSCFKLKLTKNTVNKKCNNIYFKINKNVFKIYKYLNDKILLLYIV